MICATERKKLLVAKSLYAQGIIPQEKLYEVAEEYRVALLALRKAGHKVGGKPLWVPSSAHRLICITVSMPGE